MAELIRKLSTTTIGPASGDRHRDFNRRIELTPSDLQLIWIDYINRGLLFEKSNEIPVEHLKATLSQALDRLYPLAGRLVATEHDGDAKTISFHIDCNGAGVTFVHAKADDSIKAADILNRAVVPTEIIERLFPMTGVGSYKAAGSDISLIAVQVTEFADGVFVGLNRNHTIADDTTLWDFFNVWSELARGDSAAILGRGAFVFGRECLDGLVDFPVRIPVPECPLGDIPPAPLQQRVFRFSKAKITELKARANKDVLDGDCEISSLQALFAHLWVCITRSRALRDDETVCFTLAVGMRSRLRPPLPQSYVGNAVVYEEVTCAAGELLRHGMGWAALLINKAIAKQAARETREFFDESMKRLPSPLELEKSPPNILVGGSSRFDVYGNDFGWGRPVALRSGLAGSIDGKLNVSPGAEDGSIDFEATLSPETLRALAGDPEFTRYSF